MQSSPTRYSDWKPQAHIPKASTAVRMKRNLGAPVEKITLVLENLTVAMTDATTNGCHGTVKLLDFDAGAFMLLGAMMDIHVATEGSGDISDTANLVGGLGTATVGTGNETLTSTEQDIVGSTALALVDGEGDFAALGNGNATLFDGTTTAKDLYLNIVAAAADADDDDVLTVNGKIVLLVAWLGDYDA